MIEVDEVARDGEEIANRGFIHAYNRIMTHQAILALVSAIWVGLEIVVSIVTRGTSREDRGSYRVLWTLLITGTVAGSMVKSLLRMPPELFWVGIALIAIGIVIRATAILTLRRYFTVRVTIQDSHDLIERGLYRWIRHPSYAGALVSFVGLGMAFDLGSPGDTTKSGYTFGTKFTLGGSTGVRWFPTRRVMVNADFRAQLWRLRYPASFSFPAPDGSRVVPLTDPSTDWTLHPWISLGVGWTF